MGYLTCELDGNLGLWMLFLLFVVIGCKFCFCGVGGEGKRACGGLSAL
jgi:hypothetical protein